LKKEHFEWYAIWGQVSYPDGSNVGNSNILGGTLYGGRSVGCGKMPELMKREVTGLATLTIGDIHDGLRAGKSIQGEFTY